MLKLQEFSSLRELIKKFPIVEALVGKMGAILEPMVQDPEEIFAAPVLVDPGPVSEGVHFALIAQVWWQDTRAPDAPYGITFYFAPAGSDSPRATTKEGLVENEREFARLCRERFPEVFSGKYVRFLRVGVAAGQEGTILFTALSWGRYETDGLLEFMDGGPVSKLTLYDDYHSVCINRSWLSGN